MAEDAAALRHHPKVVQVVRCEHQGIVGGHVLVDAGPEDFVHQGQGLAQFIGMDGAGFFHGKTPGGMPAAA